MFDLDEFVADCRSALRAGDAHAGVREVVARAVSDPGAVLRGLGEPRRAELCVLHRSPDLTVLNVIWAPGMTLLPHDHRTWGVIGIYTGREDNIFWRRIPGDPSRVVEQPSDGDRNKRRSRRRTKRGRGDEVVRTAVEYSATHASVRLRQRRESYDVRPSP